jgi:hypothetical protein
MKSEIARPLRWLLVLLGFTSLVVACFGNSRRGETDADSATDAAAETGDNDVAEDTGIAPDATDDDTQTADDDAETAETTTTTDVDDALPCTPEECAAMDPPQICTPDGCQPPPLQECENQGDVCDLTQMDQPGYFCLDDGTGVGVCRRKCDLEADPDSCPMGSLCIDFSEGRYPDGGCFESDCTSVFNSAEECADVGEHGGTCRPELNGTLFCSPAGTASEGDACSDEMNATPGERCESGLLCVGEVCEAPCEVGGSYCTAPEDCVAIFDGHPDLGLCEETCPPFSTGECSEGLGCFPSSPTVGICVEVGDIPVGEPCGDLSEGSCVEGAICLLETESEGTCTAICSPTAGPGDPGYCTEEGEACFELNAEYIGACFPGCTPFCTGECPEGQGCFPADMETGRGICVDVGTLEAGESCGDVTADDCGENMVCLLETENEGACSVLCDPYYEEGDLCGACPSETQICSELSIPGVGACQEGCDPWAAENTCDANEGCFPNEDGETGLCVGVGTAGAGDVCEPPYVFAACGAGLLCLPPDSDACDDHTSEGACTGDPNCAWDPTEEPGYECGSTDGFCEELCKPFDDTEGNCGADGFCAIMLDWLGTCLSNDELLGLDEMDTCTADQTGWWCTEGVLCVGVTGGGGQCVRLCRIDLPEGSDCEDGASCVAAFGDDYPLGACLME